MNHKSHIIIHYSDSENGDIRVFEKHHKEINGWSHVGYNYVIPRDASIENIIGEKQAGIHAPGYNENSIGICIVADKTHQPNKYQYRTLIYLCHMLIGRYNIEIKNILGHKETGRETDCPGPINMDNLRKQIEQTRNSYKIYCYTIDSMLAKY